MVLVLVAGMFLAGAGTAQAADKVLVFSKTAGFRHDSIRAGDRAGGLDRRGQRL